MVSGTVLGKVCGAAPFDNWFFVVKCSHMELKGPSWACEIPLLQRWIYTFGSRPGSGVRAIIAYSRRRMGIQAMWNECVR